MAEEQLVEQPAVRRRTKKSSRTQQIHRPARRRRHEQSCLPVASRPSTAAPLAAPLDSRAPRRSTSPRRMSRTDSCPPVAAAAPSPCPRRALKQPRPSKTPTLVKQPRPLPIPSSRPLDSRAPPRLARAAPPSRLARTAPRAPPHAFLAASLPLPSPCPAPRPSSPRPSSRPSPCPAPRRPPAGSELRLPSTRQPRQHIEPRSPRVL